MEKICVQNGTISAFGLIPGRSTIEEIASLFGPCQSVELVSGVSLHSFLDGDLVAAVQEGDQFFSTLILLPGICNASYVPQTLDDAKSVFPNLKIPNIEQSGLLLAECSGVKLACDMSFSAGKVLWLEIYRL